MAVDERIAMGFEQGVAFHAFCFQQCGLIGAQGRHVETEHIHLILQADEGR